MRFLKRQSGCWVLLVKVLVSCLPFFLLVGIIEMVVPGFIRPIAMIRSHRQRSLNWEYIATLPAAPVRIVGGAWDNQFEKAGWDYDGRHTFIFLETLEGTYRIDSAFESRYMPVERSEVSTNNTDCGVNETIWLPDEVMGTDIFWCGEFDAGRDHYAILSDRSVWKGRIIYMAGADLGFGIFVFLGAPLCVLALIRLVITLKNKKQGEDKDTAKQRARPLKV